MPGRERRAYLCPICASKDGTPTRRFLGPDDKVPKCPVHRVTMVRQPNVPYRRPKP